MPKDNDNLLLLKSQFDSYNTITGDEGLNASSPSPQKKSCQPNECYDARAAVGIVYICEASSGTMAYVSSSFFSWPLWATMSTSIGCGLIFASAASFTFFKCRKLTTKSEQKDQQNVFNKPQLIAMTRKNNEGTHSDSDSRSQTGKRNRP